MKTIQSRSYGSFSRNILNKWLLYFALKEPVVPETRLTEQARTENEIRKKLENELKKFMDFSSAYTKTIITMAHREEKYDALEPPKQKLFDIWLTDQTGKALDLYWAPLSQIASQYASAPYS